MVHTAMKEDTERTPLRTILTNFLNHIETLENQRTPDNTYESEFQELKLFSESIKGLKQFSCSEGEKEVNRKKNRYKDILPFDASRVVLSEYAGVPGSDYINANYIRGASGSPAYIASQGPLPNTVNDFWRLVVQCEVQVIVMACNEEEAGKHKCENYWVEGEGEEKQFGMVSLRLIKASTVCPDFSVRTMRIKYTNTQSNTEERTVCQFHYSAWPDHGVPPLVRPLLDMVRLVRDTQASETLPVLVHCSAGCGRTGTICAIDYVWGLLRAGKLRNDFSLLALVREMRRQRIAMVQTKQQYVLVHQAVRELFKEQLRMIDSHPYENIDSNGLPLIKCPSPEPMYDTISPYQNNNTEEKQDEKEKDLAPPLPQKKRFHTLSSKQAKEVENLSERQRLVERSEGGPTGGGQRPRIATLRSLFERQHSSRDSRQVSRSHSLGAVRPAQQSPVEVKEQPVPKPIPGRGILRLPQVESKPALPVKRSKSLRVLGSSDRHKLSVPPAPADKPPTPDQVDMPRRLSLESNYEEMKDLVHMDSPHQPLLDYLSVDSIVAGLGVRERRNSFRQAVRRETQDTLSHVPKKPGLLRSYTSVDIRSTRGKTNINRSALPVKPLLQPKPDLQNRSNGRTVENSKVPRDPRYQSKNWPQPVKSHHVTLTNEQKNSQVQPGSSRTLTSHSMRLQLATKPRREDARVPLNTSMSKQSAFSNLTEQMYSSGESTKSASSDQSLPSNKAFNKSHSRSSSKPRVPGSTNDSTDLDKHTSKSVNTHQNIVSPRYQDNVIAQSQDKTSPSVIGYKDHGQFGVHNVSTQGHPGRLEPNNIVPLQKTKSSVELGKTPPIPSMRPVVYESKGLRQNSTPIYRTTSKPSPPPYVEPGKNAQKPRSSPHFITDKHINSISSYDEIYGKTQDPRHMLLSSSSRDLVLPSHSAHGRPNPLHDSRSLTQDPGMMHSRGFPERRQAEQDFRNNPQDINHSKINDRLQGAPDERLQQQDSQNERRYVEKDVNIRQNKKFYEQDHQKNLQESKSPSDRHNVEQVQQQNSLDYYSKSYSDRRTLDLSLKHSLQDPQAKTALDRREKEFMSNQQQTYHRNLREKRINQEYHNSLEEGITKVGEKRVGELDFNSSSQETFPTSSERVSIDQNARNSLHEHYPSIAERKSALNYQPSPQDVYSKMPVDRRTVDQDQFQDVYSKMPMDRRTVDQDQFQDVYSKMPMDRRTVDQDQFSAQDTRVQLSNRTYRQHDAGQWTPRTPANDLPSGDRLGKESSTPATLGVKMRRGSRDDLALCATTPSRVKRHASVVMLRHSLIEGAASSPADPNASPLSVWSQTNASGDSGSIQNTPIKDDGWSGALGVDLDQVAASITSHKDDKMMRAALEALHLRKASQATPKSTATPRKGAQQTPKASQSAQKPAKPAQTTPGHFVESSPSAPPPLQSSAEAPKPGLFRKQQQYL